MIVDIIITTQGCQSLTNNFEKNSNQSDGANKNFKKISGNEIMASRNSRHYRNLLELFNTAWVVFRYWKGGSDSRY